jgi:hypothetical protein
VLKVNRPLPEVGPPLTASAPSSLTVNSSIMGCWLLIIRLSFSFIIIFSFSLSLDYRLIIQLALICSGGSRRQKLSRRWKDFLQQDGEMEFCLTLGLRRIDFIVLHSFSHGYGLSRITRSTLSVYSQHPTGRMVFRSGGGYFLFKVNYAQHFHQEIVA